MAPTPHAHKAKLKQVNKPFKGGSKKNKAKGRLSSNPLPKSVLAVCHVNKSNAIISKKIRLQASKQKRENSKRAASGDHVTAVGAPKVVMLLPFKSTADALSLKKSLTDLLLQGSAISIDTRRTKEKKCLQLGGLTMTDDELTANGCGLVSTDNRVCNPLNYQAAGAEDCSNINKRDLRYDAEPDMASRLPGAPITLTLPSWAAMSQGTKNQRITLLDAAPYLYPAAEVTSSTTEDIQSHTADEPSEGQTSGLASLFRVPTAAMIHVLDIAKLADIIVCVFSDDATLDDPPFDSIGYELLSAIKLQGLPTPLGVCISSCKTSGQKDVEAGAVDVDIVKMDQKTRGPKGHNKDNSNAKLVARYFRSEFGDERKFQVIDSEGDLKNLVRKIANLCPKPLTWRTARGYVVPSAVPRISRPDQIEDQQPLAVIAGDETLTKPLAPGSRLVVEGIVRGVGLSVRHPIHLTGIGDFVIDKISVATNTDQRESCLSKMAAKLPASDAVQDNLRFTLADELSGEAEFELQRAWTPLLPYDPLSGDQTFPTDEDLKIAESNKKHSISGRVIRVPKGTSEYQRAWFEEGDDDDEYCNENGIDDNNSDGEEGGDVKSDNGDGNRNNELSDEEGDDDSTNQINESSRPSLGTISSSGKAGVDDIETLPYETLEDMSRERRRLKTVELEARCREDMEFPDEVDVPTDRPARERFARYRALKSYRNSPWDPYEDLPPEYSRVHEFESLKQVAKIGRKQFVADCNSFGVGNLAGQLVRIEIRLSDVEPEEKLKLSKLQKYLSDIKSGAPHTPLIVSTLLPYERKVSVVHATVNRHDEFDGQLPSKGLVEFQCGFRRFPGRPLYSQGNVNTLKAGRHAAVAGSKCKVQRYLHQPSAASMAATTRVTGTAASAGSIASFFGPSIMPPSPLLLFVNSNSSDRSDDSNAGVIDNVAHEGCCGPSMTKLACWGDVVDCNPRVVLTKRIVLTGYPFRVHKRKAVIRYMFFNADDIRWFMPVELTTKRGLRGNIKEPLGTHGYMKCIFNDRVTQDDTICMNLYKRSFPKWHPPTWGGLPDATYATA